MIIEDDKVIDIKSRKPYQQVRKERAAAKRKAKRQEKLDAQLDRQEHREAMLGCLRQVMKLVEEDKLEGLVLISREPKSKLFLTDVVLDDRIIAPNELHAFVGCMEALKIEIADAAAMAPALGLDGSVITPEVMEEEDFEE